MYATKYATKQYNDIPGVPTTMEEPSVHTTNFCNLPLFINLIWIKRFIESFGTAERSHDKNSDHLRS